MRVHGRRESRRKKKTNVRFPFFLFLFFLFSSASSLFRHANHPWQRYPSAVSTFLMGHASVRFCAASGAVFDRELRWLSTRRKFPLQKHKGYFRLVAVCSISFYDSHTWTRDLSLSLSSLRSLIVVVRIHYDGPISVSSDRRGKQKRNTSQKGKRGSSSRRSSLRHLHTGDWALLARQRGWKCISTWRWHLSKSFPCYFTSSQQPIIPQVFRNTKKRPK